MERCRSQSRHAWLLGIAVAAGAHCALSHKVHAAEVAYGVNAGVGQSDNIHRTATDEVDETIGTVGVYFGLKQESRRFTTNLFGDFSYLDYLDNTYDNEVVGSFGGELTAGIIPDRIEWFAVDSFGQTTTQVAAVVTPENRENVNFFSTGPRVTIGSGWLRTQLEGHYTNVAYETTELDSERYGGGLSLIHDISAASSVALTGSYEDVDYSSDGNTDFERSEAFVRYKLTGARTELALDVGYTEVSDEFSDSSGTLARLSVTRRTSPSSAVSLSLGRDFSDAGNIFQQLQSQQVQQAEATTGTQPVQPLSSPFVNKYVTVGWSYDRSRNGLALSATRFDETYEDDPLNDRTRTTYGLTARRDMRPTLQARLSADRTEEDYERPNQDFSELYLSATLSWSAGARTTIDFQYEFFDRDSDAVDGDFRENRFWIRASYGVGTISRSTMNVPVDTGTYR